MRPSATSRRAIANRAGGDGGDAPRSRVPDWLTRTYSLPVEAGIVAAVLVVWQAARIPVGGGVGEALRNAHRWRSVEASLHLRGVQNDVIALVHHPVLLETARWSYANLHVFAIFAFMVALRGAAPDRYPVVRSAFGLLHILALLAIAVFPLASPYWLPHPPQWAGGHPALTGSLSIDLRNLTAAVASEHFGYSVLIACGTLWAARGRMAAWLIALYPVWVFVVIVGTGRHYPLDTIVGTLCVVAGALAAWSLHRGTVRGGADRLHRQDRWPRWAAAGLAAGLLGGWADAVASGRVHPMHPAPLAFAAPLAAAALIALVRRQRRGETVRPAQGT